MPIISGRIPASPGREGHFLSRVLGRTMSLGRTEVAVSNYCLRLAGLQGEFDGAGLAKQRRSTIRASRMRNVPGGTAKGSVGCVGQTHPEQRVMD